MEKSKPLLTLLFAGTIAFACAGGTKGQSEADRARQLLLKTLQRNFSQNVIAIITQRSPENHGTYQRIQVQISKEGKMRQTVVAPLSVQGVETIDDGNQIATYLPDEKFMFVQESPRLLPDDTMSRVNLAIRNYGLKIGGTSIIAGKSASILVATPRAKDMEVRRYHIDERTGFLLQLETVDSSGTPKVAFKAEQVTYPSRISASTFVIDLASRTGTKIVFRRRFPVDATVKGTPEIGFEPVMLEGLPNGFEIQDAQINDSGSYRSVAIRITDGLVKGTVYQYSLATAKKMKAMPGTTIGDGSGLRFVVAADVPESVRKRILNAFLDAAKKSDSDLPMVGLLGPVELSQICPAFTRTEALALEIWQSTNNSLIPLHE
ncbi:MAG: hypothetical protein H7Y17_00415 [Chlorobia bacterium]|nr:hypothetical protein [Fimbriimonadaceae bacterium]